MVVGEEEKKKVYRGNRTFFFSSVRVSGGPGQSWATWRSSTAAYADRSWARCRTHPASERSSPPAHPRTLASPDR